MTINISPSLAEGLDNPSLGIVYGGSQPWFNQSNVFYSMGDAAQSGTIFDGGSSSFQTTVTGPFGLSFYWQVDCEPIWDGVRFEIDGAQQKRLTGIMGWRQESYLIPAGTHLLKWTYYKDGADSIEADAAWVDQIVLGSPASNVSSATSVFGTVGEVLVYSLTGLYNPTSYDLTGALPPGLVYAPSINQVIGTPSRSGSWTVSGSATNSYGTNSAPITFTIRSAFQGWTSTNSLAGVEAQPTADSDRDADSTSCAAADVIPRRGWS